MIRRNPLTLLLCLVLALASSLCFGKPRVIVLTDIGNEPDDSESMVRLLLYANELDVEGLLATTSTWQRTVVHPEMIEARVRAYGRVLANLKVHAPGYPEMEKLLSLIKAGRAQYGMSGVGTGKDTDASRLIIAAADRADARPLWITIWGGSAELAQALWTVRATRPAEAVARFVGKLRVYSISDQDDSGSWIRANFPSLFWIASSHAFGEYSLAAWTGISASLPGADSSVVSPQWLDANIRKGPLGEQYPRPMYIMEGDTGSFLYLIPNGLGSPEHPDWGSWGGRYGLVGPSLGLWSDTTDRVTGIDGVEYRNNQATLWRWRREFQNDFAARIAWTLTGTFDDANHAPDVVLNGQGGVAPVEVRSCANRPVQLSAAGTRDPDGKPLHFRYWNYREASGQLSPQDLRIDGADSAEAVIVAPPARKPAPNVDLPAETRYHIILSVTDEGAIPLTRYRRAILTIPTAGTAAGDALGCKTDR
jgi:hypothetical protein